ncbi:hypothetical protein NEUTE1DRAFT_112424 [Neurospora tetrasperma FGSC 2508]|uniref:Uncharacterized protein n=1 Tax=Neurospora tetrasperma (strain FGSC 2508 / ATCC MYA-4615 / P0657) TaxID=510951 RepID=F8MSS7_NEUT8|nr:uncharacterized protein NEUTE1DRAFT_112424 [Neurospora tetrasperma FGSC 2508]EGO55963.1 hypothetical protein NEUTE1DRAFT_112424 [Neurospora tetrasperma FGSC 2508]
MPIDLLCQHQARISAAAGGEIKVRGKPVTTQYFSSSPSLQDCHEKATHLEERCANLQQNYADLAAQQKRMQWALTVISALPIEFVDKQQQLPVKAAIANYIGDEVSIIGLIIRWGFRNLNLDRDNTIKVFEGQTEVGEVASADLREDKLFAVAGPGAGVFKGWELYCDSSALNTILSQITKFGPLKEQEFETLPTITQVSALFQKENDARRAVEVLNQSSRSSYADAYRKGTGCAVAWLAVKGARLKVLFVRPMLSVTGEGCLGRCGLGPGWNYHDRMGFREEERFPVNKDESTWDRQSEVASVSWKPVKPPLDRHTRNIGELLYFLVDERSGSSREGSMGAPIMDAGCLQGGEHGFWL